MYTGEGGRRLDKNVGLYMQYSMSDLLAQSHDIARKVFTFRASGPTFPEQGVKPFSELQSNRRVSAECFPTW